MSSYINGNQTIKQSIFSLYTKLVISKETKSVLNINGNGLRICLMNRSNSHEYIDKTGISSVFNVKDTTKIAKLMICHLQGHQ